MTSPNRHHSQQDIANFVGISLASVSNVSRNQRMGYQIKMKLAFAAEQPLVVIAKSPGYQILNWVEINMVRQKRAKLGFTYLEEIDASITIINQVIALADMTIPSNAHLQVSLSQLRIQRKKALDNIKEKVGKNGNGNGRNPSETKGVN